MSPESQPDPVPPGSGSSDPAASQSPDPRVPLARSRTLYAAFRTSLAMDRTTLAWVRTTLTMTSFGLGVIGFFRSVRQASETPQTIQFHHEAVLFGIALVLLGVLSTVAVAIWHLRTIRQLRAGVSPLPALWPLSVMLAVLLGILSLAGLWAFYA